MQKEYQDKEKKLYLCFVDLEKAFDRDLKKWVGGMGDEEEVSEMVKAVILIASFLSSCHEKVTEALCIGRIQTRLGVALVSEFSA